MEHDHHCKTTCGVSKTIKMIGSRWTLFIIHALCEGPLRFKELERELTGISPRTLSLKLKDLEKNRILTKTIISTVPLHIQYELTTQGKELRNVIDAMRVWGELSS